MTERAFFTLRYALPGYTFILMAFLVIYPNLDGVLSISELTTINGVLLTAFLTFFTLLSGGAIGFLISQVWYFVHNSVLKGNFVKETRNFLKEEFHLSDDVSRQLVFLDYVFHTSDNSPIGYVQRRLDLKHILGSTIFSIIFGGILGILIRLDLSLTQITLAEALTSINWDLILAKFAFSVVSLPLNPFLFNESFLFVTLYDLILFSTASIFIIILFLSFRKISSEHSNMADVVVRKIVKKEKTLTFKDAKTCFNDEYFEN